MAKIAAITTMARGIEFRSRLEASWYCFLCDLGFSVQYEPECVEVERLTTGDAIPHPDGSRDGFCELAPQPRNRYLPDFLISNGSSSWYVEIKPYPIQEESDWRSIALACILGYCQPHSIIVSGWPLEYMAVLINNRHKGNPEGSHIRFAKSEIRSSSRLGIVWCNKSYPDECELTIEPGDRWNFLDGAEKIENELKTIASRAWNETKFRWNKNF